MPASVSKIDVINTGLALVGAKKLTAETDDTKAARLAKSLYPIAMRDAFDLPINWHFATARKELSALATDPDFGYDYQYELPSACRRVIALVDEDDRETEYEWRREVWVDTSTSHEREYDVLLTDQDEAFIKYIRLREDTNKWPSYFMALVYLKLAILLCEPLKQDKQKKNQILLMYEEALTSAKEGNGAEGADVDSNNVRTDYGNNDVLDAASEEETDETYIVRD